MRVFTAFELTLCRHRRLHRCFFFVHLPNHHCRIISRFISAFAVQLTCLGEREITSFANVVHFGVAWVFVCVNMSQSIAQMRATDMKAKVWSVSVPK